jgi:hypothetical protein
MQKQSKPRSLEPHTANRQSNGQRNLWEEFAVKVPEDPKEDPRGHIAFYRDLEMM